MPKVSSASRDAASTKQMILYQIETYLFPKGTADAGAFTKFRNDHLLIGIEDRDKRFVLREAGGGTPDDQISGLYALDELLNLNVKKPEAIISDLLYEGELMLLAGRPKVGKSRLIHQMTVSLSTGVPFIGMNVPRRRRVLLVDLENKPWAIQDRLKRMMGESSAANANVFVWCSNTLAENSINSGADGRKALEKLIIETDAEVLIIDPWRLWLGGNENEAKDVVEGLKTLTALRKNRPCLTIIIVHHVRKERFESPANLMRDPLLWVENISGHYALVGHVDACYGLERQEQDGEEIVIFGGIARNVESRAVLLNDDPDSLKFEVATTEDAAKIVMTSKELELWEKAKKKKEFTWSAFLAVAGTTNKKAVSQMLKKAEAHGLIQKSERGYRVLG